MFELYLRETGVEELDFFLNKVEVLYFGEDTAKIASGIDKRLKKQGQMIDIKDLFIAASCIENKHQLLTFNKKHFEKIKELELAEL